MSVPFAIGLDIGGTKIAGAAIFAAPAGAVHGTVFTAPTPGDSGPQAILAEVTNILEKILAENSDNQLQCVGVGSAGTIDAAQGTVVAATKVLRDWTGTNIRGHLDGFLTELGFTVPIVVENDVNAHALGEMWLGAGREHKSALIFALGTGVGGAAVVDGNMIHGAHHGGGDLGHIPVAAAGELPCTCGATGHLESVAAGPAIARQFGGDETKDARVVFAAAATGDPKAQAVLNRAAEGLGQAMAAGVAVLDPNIIIIGGGVEVGS